MLRYLLAVALPIFFASSHADPLPVAESASHFNLPQPKPLFGPWYEGWYVRVTDASKDFSFATITTSDTPERIALRQDSVLPGYVTFLYRAPGTANTVSREYFPERTVSERREENGEEHFTWSAEGFGHITDRSVSMTYPSGDEVEVSFGKRKPWSASLPDWGPEGMGTYLPFAPLYWYVDTIGTPVHYRVKLAATGAVVEGDGLAHVEKNWGRIFPRAWMWLQGVAPANDAYVALAGGPLGVQPLEVTTYLIGFKTNKVDMELRPDQLTRYQADIDDCRGHFHLVAENLRDRIEVTADADAASFGPVSIPTDHGYEQNRGKESFGAKITVRAFREGKLADERTFTGAALEFGADNMKCSAPRGAF